MLLSQKCLFIFLYAFTGLKIYPHTSGARRGLLNLPIDEEVGLVGLHWGDQFHEFVPWKGDVRWEVAPWGSWKVTASNETHKVLVEATCNRPGSPLRAPTADNGLAPLCKDSFFGKVQHQLNVLSHVRHSHFTAASLLASPL